MDTAYESSLGAITPMDMIYGFTPELKQGNDYMEHKTGFTARVLANLLIQSGFLKVTALRNRKIFSLWAFATKTVLSDDILAQMRNNYFPMKT